MPAQMTGIFPTRISSDFMTITFEPLLFVWTAVVKIMLWSLILLVMYVWLDEQGFTFGDLLSRAMSSDRFTNTDYFAIIAHYIFLQVAAYFLFFNNLTLCSHLTKLNFVLKQLSMSTATTVSGVFRSPVRDTLIHHGKRVFSSASREKRCWPTRRPSA